MNQRKLRRLLEGVQGDLLGGYDPDADVRESIVDWLLEVAGEAAFGREAVGLEFAGAIAAFGSLEAVVREPLRLEVRIRRGRSRVRAPTHDFFVEYHVGDAVVAEGAALRLSSAVMHAARSLART